MPLPTGPYTFFYILDRMPDGVLNDLSWYDYVNVMCSPEGLDARTSFLSEPLSEEDLLNKIKALVKP